MRDDTKKAVIRLRHSMPLNLSVPRELYEQLKAEAGVNGNMRAVARRILASHFNPEPRTEEVMYSDFPEKILVLEAKLAMAMDLLERFIGKK